MILTTYMILLYVALASLALYFSIRYVEVESKHVRKPVLKIMSAVTRLFFILKLIANFLRKPFTYVIIANLVLAVLIATYSAVPTQATTKLTSLTNEGRQPAILIGLREPTQVNCSSIMQELSNVLRISESHGCLEFLRLSLSKPLTINISKFPIYVVVGASASYLRENLGKPTFYYGSVTALGTKAAELILPSGRSLALRLQIINEEKIKELTIYDSIPLLPIQSYMGSKPVLPPPKYVLVAPINYVIKLFGGGVTDVLVTGVRINGSVLSSLLTYLINKYPVSKIYYFSSDGVYLVSRTQIPTLRSLSTAVLSAAIMAVLAISLFTSIKPYINTLYWRLTLQGFPPWGMNIVLLTYVTLLVLAVGVPALAFAYTDLGSVSTLNGLVTVVLTWLVMSAYVIKEIKVPTLRSDVYITPTEKYTVVTSINNIELLTGLIDYSLRGNEFFKVEGIEKKGGLDEALVHGRLTYNESWGSGADVSIVITREDESTMVSITTNVWGVEEVSDVVIREIISLITSRIVGVIRSWEQLHLR